MSWQSISTLPKDTWVLLWEPGFIPFTGMDSSKFAGGIVEPWMLSLYEDEFVDTYAEEIWRASVGTECATMLWQPLPDYGNP